MSIEDHVHGHELLVYTNVVCICSTDGTQTFAPQMVHRHLHHRWYTDICSTDGTQTVAPQMTNTHCETLHGHLHPFGG